MMEKQIQVVIARADIIICSIIRWLSIILPLLVILALAVFFARKLLGYKSCWIDYDAPHVDITSEGPDNDVDEWSDAN